MTETLKELLSVTADMKKLAARQAELRRAALQELGPDATTEEVAGFGKVTVSPATKKQVLNVEKALANFLGVELATKASRSAQIAQLEKALRDQGHLCPRQTKKVSARLIVTPNVLK